MKSTKKVVMSPLCEMLNEMDLKRKNVIIHGSDGGGKTTLLKEVMFRWNDQERLLVDATLKKEEYTGLADNLDYDLYYVCLIIRKILISLENNFPDEFKMHFGEFSKKILLISELVRNNEISDKELVSDPFTLIDELLNLIVNHLGYEVITLIMDDIDRKGDASNKLKNLIYGRLKNYFNFIVTTSEEPDSNELDGEQIIKIDYNNNIGIVKEILAQEAYELMLEKDKYDSRFRVGFLFSNDFISEMIIVSNNNLYYMINAMRDFYKHIDELTEDEYKIYLLSRIAMLMKERKESVRKRILKED